MHEVEGAEAFSRTKERVLLRTGPAQDRSDGVEDPFQAIHRLHQKS